MWRLCCFAARRCATQRPCCNGLPEDIAPGKTGVGGGAIAGSLPISPSIHPFISQTCGQVFSRAPLQPRSSGLLGCRLRSAWNRVTGEMSGKHDGAKGQGGVAASLLLFCSKLSVLGARHAGLCRTAWQRLPWRRGRPVQAACMAAGWPPPVLALSMLSIMRLPAPLSHRPRGRRGGRHPLRQPRHSAHAAAAPLQCYGQPGGGGGGGGGRGGGGGSRNVAPLRLPPHAVGRAWVLLAGEFGEALLRVLFVGLGPWGWGWVGVLLYSFGPPG